MCQGWSCDSFAWSSQLQRQWRRWSQNSRMFFCCQRCRKLFEFAQNLTFSDVDASDDPSNLMIVQLDCIHGFLSLGSRGGLRMLEVLWSSVLLWLDKSIQGYGDGDNRTMKFQGAYKHLVNALKTVLYHPYENFNGGDQLKITVYDDERKQNLLCFRWLFVWIDSLLFPSDIRTNSRTNT